MKNKRKFYLYHSLLCSYCYQVISRLDTLKVKVELKDITEDDNFSVLKKGGGSPQVPCLRIVEGDEESWLYESSDIISFLEEQ